MKLYESKCKEVWRMKNINKKILRNPEPSETTTRIHGRFALCGKNIMLPAALHFRLSDGSFIAS